MQKWTRRKKPGIDHVPTHGPESFHGPGKNVAQMRTELVTNFFCYESNSAYLSGLSEAHTESISPTSKVPWKGAKMGGRESLKHSTHDHDIPRSRLSKEAKIHSSFLH